MGVLSFLRVAKRPSASATPSTAPATQPHGPARKSADANLERLEQEFGHAVAPAASALREATQWHRNGRKADAWVAFEQMLSDPTMGGSAQVRPAIESEIYSRMRICFEREGCFNPALTPAVLSYATRAKFYAVQGREAELQALRSPEFFERYFMPLLERARVQHAMAKFRMVVEDQLRAMPMVDLHVLKNAVEAFRLNPPSAPQMVVDRRFS
ncbi:MAG: hypothetical protein WCH32_10755 [Pseudomonadota bacterium]